MCYAICTAAHFARCVLVHRLDEDNRGNYTRKQHKCNSFSAVPCSRRQKTASSHYWGQDNIIAIFRGSVSMWPLMS